MYQYPLNPIQVIDPMGLDAIENMTSGGLIYAVSGVPGLCQIVCSTPPRSTTTLWGWPNRPPSRGARERQKKSLQAGYG